MLALAASGLSPAAASDTVPPAPAPAVLEPIDAASPAAPAPTAEGVREQIGALARRGLYDGSILVVDPATQTVLYSRAADRPRIPASTTKLATAAAALHVLGPQTRLPTIAYRDGGTVYLVGGGDPTLVRSKGGDPLAGGRASLRDLARSVAAAFTTQTEIDARVRRVGVPRSQARARLARHPSRRPALQRPSPHSWSTAAG